MQEVIGLFGSHRLLSFDRNPTTGGPTVEVAHEALLREWNRLRDWLDGSREDLRRQAALAAGAREWEEAGREPDYLYAGSRLAGFENWRADTSLPAVASLRDSTRKGRICRSAAGPMR